MPRYEFLTTTAVESYSRAVPGVELNAVQTGIGFGPNTMRSVAYESATIAVASVGFPVRGQMTVSDDWIITATVSSAPPGTRWCGYDLKPGDTLLYAPAAEHTAVSPAGVEYTAAIVQRRRIEAVADEFRLRLEIPARGSVRLLHPTSNSRSTASLLKSAVLPANDSEHLATLRTDIVGLLALELTEEADEPQLERMSLRESRRIVRCCLEYVYDAGGRPSTAVLCHVAFVSERRLRGAFVDAFGVPPMQYFRDQAPNEARTRLLATSNRQTVMEIAIDVGIQNGGRFAHRYFELFGQLPSTTLREAS